MTSRRSGLPAFRIRTRQTAEEEVVVTPIGELDAEACSTLSRALDDVLAPPGSRPGPDSIVIDLGETSFIDSKALHVLILHHDRARREGRRFSIARDTGLVRRLLIITGLTSVFARSDIGRMGPGPRVGA